MANRKIVASDAELAAEYESGLTMAELAKKYGVCPRAIMKRLRKAGVVGRPARRRTIYDRESVKAEVVRMYESGKAMSDVASQLGVGRATVWRTLRVAGVKPRPQGLRQPTTRIPESPVALGYFAGLLDGEGNLQMRGKPRTNGTDTIGCKMAIYSTTPAVMDWLHKAIGGSVRWERKRAERKGWLPIGIWEVCRAWDIALLLHAVLPHLLIKKAVAEKMLIHFKEHFEIGASPGP
jgi:transposase-like protein